MSGGCIAAKADVGDKNPPSFGVVAVTKKIHCEIYIKTQAERPAPATYRAQNLLDQALVPRGTRPRLPGETFCP